MSIDLVIAVSCIALLWLPISTWYDMKLYRDPHTRKLVYEERKIRGKHQLFMAYLHTNATEIGLFLVGFWLAAGLAGLGLI